MIPPWMPSRLSGSTPLLDSMRHPQYMSVVFRLSMGVIRVT